MDCGRNWRFITTSCQLLSQRAMTNMFQGRCLLFVYHQIDLFTLRLQEALDRTAIETLLARTPDQALVELARARIDGALISYRSELEAQYRQLLDAVAGLPTLLL